ncbi:hypothetical protein KSP40_PGU014066 [Platanthera guangdongensis]|uniref:Uncharacterized protein n=1 Tax=Platanthera guangdongensis TaxID=2320717 RepID=A0ABR2MFF6_9ASPA
MGTLAPLAEEPISEEEGISKRGQPFGIRWLKKKLFRRKSNMKALLSVMACPLSPVSVPRKHPRAVASTADYIIQQFWATSGCGKMESKAMVKTMYAAGRVAMAGKLDPNDGSSSAQDGSFVLWQMSPARWLFDLKIAGFQVAAGSDGHVAWRRTPWLGAHAAKGGVRPLRRLLQASGIAWAMRPITIRFIWTMLSVQRWVWGYNLQGLDSTTIAAVFSSARHVGHKQIDEEECFVLRLEADHSRLSDQSDAAVEIIQHAMLGYFGERSGLLLHMEDSQLMRMQSPGSQAVFWKTTISSWMKDYSPADGVMVARSGRSVVNLEQFGAAGDKNSSLSTIMEEKWTIDDVVFNVPGLSAEFFIPPRTLQSIS